MGHNRGRPEAVQIIAEESLSQDETQEMSCFIAASVDIRSWSVDRPHRNLPPPCLHSHVFLEGAVVFSKSAS